MQNVGSVHLKHNMYSFLSVFFFGVTEFFIYFILTRTYQKPEYAHWVYYITIAVSLEVFRYGLIITPLIHYLARAGDRQQARAVTGSAWVITILITIIIYIIFKLVMVFFSHNAIIQNYQLLFRYYPYYAISVSFVNISMAVLQVKGRFLSILILRTTAQLGMLLYCLVNFLWLRLPVYTVILAQIFSYGLVGVVTIFLGYTNITSIPGASIKNIKKLFHFGKYSMGTTIGGNLLKSSDLVIIGLMMTNIDVALYSVPLKAFDIIQVPLSSLSNVAFPFLSRYSREKNMDTARNIFYKYTGFLTLLLIPVLALMFIFARLIIFIFSGAQYIETGVSTFVLRAFIIYGFLLPLDRFSGNTLDSLSLPKYNFIKVIIMLIINIIGDIIAIVLFDSIQVVALVTILTILTGVFLGYAYVHKKMKLQFSKIFVNGIEVFRLAIHYFRNAFFHNNKIQ